MTTSVKSEKRKTGWWKQTALLALPMLFLAVFFYLPLLTTFRMAWVSAREPALTAADLASIWKPLSFTFYQATLSTVLTLVVGLPAAYLFSRYLFRGKRALRALVMVPFILPTVVVAAGFNALLGPRGWLNLALMSLFDLSTPPIDLIYTLVAILLAHLFYNTSVIIRLVGSAWSRLDINLEQAGRVLGAGRWQVFREITLPLLKPVILSASLLVFLFDFTSFGVILLLGGPKYATLEAIRVPQKVARLALEAMKLCLLDCQKGNANAISDGATGGALAMAAITGTGYNIRINSLGLEDKSIAMKCEDDLRRLQKEAAEIQVEIHRTLVERGGFDPA